tara:strand:+ start:22650 stop:23039 length:390 start_codon:yes stop_codon:yes gene_type:complete
MEQLINLDSVLWFFMGAIASTFLSRMLDISHAAYLVNEAVSGCLLMLAKVNEDVAFVVELKHKHLADSGMDRTKVREYRQLDEKVMNDWKQLVITNMINSAPQSFSGFIKFSNWREAMRQLDEMYKKNN